jgi:hypothetical protein
MTGKAPMMRLQYNAVQAHLPVQCGKRGIDDETFAGAMLRLLPSDDVENRLYAGTWPHQ